MTDSQVSSSVAQTPRPEPASVRHVRELVQDRRLTKEFAATGDFRSALDGLRRTMEGTVASDTWLCLSVAGRAASVSKPMEREFSPLIAERIGSGLPSFVPLHDGEDRWYLAKALQSNPSPEVSEIAFDEIAREDVGEKARSVWTDIGFAASDSREHFLLQVNEGLERAFGGARSRSDVLARRIRRIVAAVRSGLMLADLPHGPGYSAELRRLFTGHIDVEGPEDRSVREEVGAELVSSLHDIVRLSVSASADPKSYEIVTDVRGWWTPASPPREIEQPARRLAGSGVDTLMVFARQGHRNAALRASLVRAAGAGAIGALARKATESDPSLPEDLSAWLVTGEAAKARRSSEVLSALSSARSEEDISRLLVLVSSPDVDPAEISRLGGEIEDLMPEAARSVSRIAGRSRQISQVVRAMARRRRLSLFLDFGQVVEFDPAQHDPVGEPVIGEIGVVHRPGTLINEPGRPPRIILKPKVRSS